MGTRLTLESIQLRSELMKPKKNNKVHNGRSLSGMDLTREKWCCARGWLSRLDVNTCQTSVKTSVLLMNLNLHHGRRYESFPV